MRKSGSSVGQDELVAHLQARIRCVGWMAMRCVLLLSALPTRGPHSHLHPRSELEEAYEARTGEKPPPSVREHGGGGDEACVLLLTRGCGTRLCRRFRLQPALAAYA